MRLSGRPQECPARRERTIAKRARGAPNPALHGPLQPMVRCPFDYRILNGILRYTSARTGRPSSLAELVNLTLPQNSKAAWSSTLCPELTSTVG